MILKGFKEKSKKNYINSQLKNRIIKEFNTKVASIGVVFNTDEINEIPDFNGLAQALGIEKEKVEVIAFKYRVEENESLFNPTFSSKQIGWRGVIKDQTLQQFLNKEFDILISYYKKDVTALKLITVASKAKLKVGVLETDERINDIIIKIEINNFSTFTSEIKAEALISALLTSRF